MYCTFITSTAAFSCMCGSAWFMMFMTTMDDHLCVSLQINGSFFQGIPEGDDEFLESWEPIGLLGSHLLPPMINFWTPNWSTRILNRPEFFESSHLNQGQRAKGKWNEQNVGMIGMAVRSKNAALCFFLPHSGSSIGRCPRSEFRSSGYAKAGANSSTSSREDLCSFDFASKHETSS